MKKLSGYEGAHGNFRPTLVDAIADIIGSAGCETVATALAHPCYDNHTEFSMTAQKTRQAIVATAGIIAKHKTKKPSK